MKAIVHKMKAHHNKQMVVSWIKLITITGSAQLIIQALGILSGIIIIRLLPKEEYGFYTLANTMLGTMTILADGGISSGVMSEGGKVWQDKKKLGIVLATGLDLRKRFSIISLLVTVPVLVYLLLRNGASAISTFLISVSLIPVFYAALSDSLLEIVPKLHQAILPLQKNSVVVSAGRILLSVVTLFAFPWTFLAILSTGIPRIYGNLQLRKITHSYVNKEELPDPIIRREILKTVKKILPLSIYYTVSGQVTIWLLSVFGNTESIGQMGALGRFSMILSILSGVFSSLIIPRFARLELHRNNLFKKYIQINFLLIGLLSLIWLGVWLFRSQLLWILGNQYAGLDAEFMLVMASACLSLVVGSNFSLLNSKGWIMNPIVGIPIGIVFIIAGAVLINVATLRGAIYFNLFLGFCSMTVQISFFLYNLYKLKR